MTDFEILTKIIHERRSVFPEMYVDKEISDSTINLILENARWAPTHKKTQPWLYKVMKGEKLMQLSEFLGNYYTANISEDNFSPMKYKKTLSKPLKSSCVLAICMKRDPTESIPEWEEIAAVAASVQNMWLSCTALGIGSYWSSPKSIESMNEFLTLEEGEKCIGLFYMGYKKEAEYTSTRTSIENKTEWL